MKILESLQVLADKKQPIYWRDFLSDERLEWVVCRLMNAGVSHDRFEVQSCLSHRPVQPYSGGHQQPLRIYDFIISPGPGSSDLIITK